MNKDIMIDAITCLDADIVENYQKYKDRLKARRSRRIRSAKWAAAAACMVIVLCAVPIARLIFGGSHGGAPVSVEYPGVYEAHVQMKRGTLLETLDDTAAKTERVTVSYRNSSAGEPIFEQPLQLLVRRTYVGGSTAVKVNFYVIFNKDNVDDNYIGGYEEQGLSKVIKGVTVHLSEIFDGANHAQAKFIYCGDLYVVDAVSAGKIDIEYFLNEILKSHRECAVTIPE